ncbi:MAG: TetR family transcriptional regulator [Microbacteriaceae bacterium]
MTAERSDPEGQRQPGLRERKRQSTRRAIQLAVLGLTIERGFDQVTIDEVSQVAGISPRTFFNYFDSKDAAVVGEIPLLSDGYQVEAFVHAGPTEDILTGIAGLFLSAAAQEEGEDREIHQLRKVVLRDHPHLLGLRMAGMRTAESALYEVVVRRLARDEPRLPAEDTAMFERGWLITLTALAALRHAWRCWAESDGAGPLDDRIRLSFTQLREIVGETS